jgi:7-cyano-7-deazaguanine reductase
MELKVVELPLLTQLGNKVATATSPDKAIIECVPVESDELRNAVIRYSCPEFSSRCPVTGQPDFARLYIDVIPNLWLPESKSLKLFLGSFREYGTFHEPGTVYIGTRIHDITKPRWIRITGVWFPRGGISIDVHWEKGSRGNIYIPALKIQTYEGR